MTAVCIWITVLSPHLIRESFVVLLLLLSFISSLHIMFMEQLITGHNRHMIFNYFPPCEGCYAFCLFLLLCSHFSGMIPLVCVLSVPLMAE